MVSRKMFAGALQGIRIDVHAIDTDGIAKTVAAFDAVQKVPEADYPDWVRFVGDDHLLTLSQEGYLAYWDIKSMKALWSAACGREASAAPSPTGKYVAVASGHRVTIIDTAFGKSLGYIDTGDRPAGRASFKSDGTVLAIVGPDSLIFWDLKTGKLFGGMDLAGVEDSRIDWGQPGYLLLPRQSLVSLLVSTEKRAIVWAYREVSMDLNHIQTMDGRIWYMATDETRHHVVGSLPLPDNTLRDSLSIVGFTRFAIKPGVGVSVQVEGGQSDANVREIVGARLKANELNVSDNQPYQVIASVQPSGTANVMGVVGRGTEMGSYQPLNERIRVEDLNHHVFWERRRAVFAPHRLVVPAGETLDQAIAATIVPEQFFRDVYIPKVIQKDSLGFGQSCLKVLNGIPVVEKFDGYESPR
jgi:hypothetical protein